MHRPRRFAPQLRAEYAPLPVVQKGGGCRSGSTIVVPKDTPSDATCASSASLSRRSYALNTHHFPSFKRVGDVVADRRSRSDGHAERCHMRLVRVAIASQLRAEYAPLPVVRSCALLLDTPKLPQWQRLKIEDEKIISVVWIVASTWGRPTSIGR